MCRMAAEVGHILEWYLPSWCCCCCGGGGAAIVIDLTLTALPVIISILNQQANVGMTDQPFSNLLIALPFYCTTANSQAYTLKNLADRNTQEFPMHIRSSSFFCTSYSTEIPWKPWENVGFLLGKPMKSHENPGIQWDFSGISARKVAEHEDCLPVPQRGVPGPLCPWGRRKKSWVNPAEPGVDPKAHPRYRNTWVNYSYT